jgi:hypothetical protein
VAANRKTPAQAAKSLRSTSAAPGPGPHLAPLGPFIAGDKGLCWHDAGKGLQAVRRILEKLDGGAVATVSPDFPFGWDDDAELTEGVRYDLEELEKILVAAQKARAGFYLTFDV